MDGTIRSNKNLSVDDLIHVYGLQSSKSVKIRLELFKILSGDNDIRCAMCGISDIRFLEFDHVSGDGREERLTISNHYTLIKYYISHPEEALKRLQILCSYCNKMHTTRIGMQRAKAQGKHIGRPVSVYDKELLIKLLNENRPRTKIAQELGISKATLYKALRQFERIKKVKSIKTVYTYSYQ